MAYQKTTWANGQAPAIDAEHLNKIESELSDLDSKTMAVSATINSVTLAATEAQGYLDTLPRLLTEDLTIYLSGTVAETLTVQNFYGLGRIRLNVKSGQSCTLSKGLLVKDCEIPVEILDMTITPDTAKTSQDCIDVEGAKYVRLNMCTITGNGSSIGIDSYKGGLALVENCTMTNHKTCAQAERGGRLCISNTSGNGAYSGNQTGAYVWRGGMIPLCEAAPDLLGGTANIHSGGLIVKADGTVI